jgi:TetR/AcrR family transcriptional regulator, cholesterol catabolism regulator
MKSGKMEGAPDGAGGGSSSTRDRIVAGARRHFFAHGFRGVTMDDLALEMSMSKKTLYVHFPSKTALLEAVLQDKIGRAEADFQRALNADGFSAQLAALLACLREHGEELQPPFLRDMSRETPELFAKVQKGRAVLIQRYFGQLFATGQKAGRIRKDVRPEFLVEMLIGAVNGVLYPQKLAELELAPKVAFTKLIGIFLEGVVTEEGRRMK